MPLTDHVTVTYRRLPGPVVFLLALVLIPVGVILACIVLIPAIVLLFAGWLWATVVRLVARTKSSLRFDGEGRRNVRVREPNG